MKSQDWVGWLSSWVLFLTVGKQVYKQWRERTSEGVSKWLFIGQVAAELGFIYYSWSVRNWVFVVANAVLLLENSLGFALVMHHRRRKGRHAISDERVRKLGWTVISGPSVEAP